MLEEEIYGANSPIWESGFTMPPSEGTQLVPRPGGWHYRLGACWGLCWSQEGPDHLPVPVLDSVCSSATVSAAVVPSTPIFSPTMGGGNNTSLSLDAAGAEPMPGGHLSPDLRPLTSNLLAFGSAFRR